MVQFNFSYAEGVSLRQMVLFETAGRIWGEYLTDPVTVNLHVDLVDSNLLPQGVLGGAIPGIQSGQNYQEFRSQYQQNITSSDDSEAFQDFSSSGAQFQFSVKDAINTQTRTYKGQSQTLDLTRANAKALGLSVDRPEALDGYIILNNLEGTDIQWNEDGARQGELTGRSVDMLTVALHEIGHTLGFVSALDNPDWLKEVWGSYDWERSRDEIQTLAESATPMDFFRYSDEEEPFDLSYGNIGGRKYFALDEGEDRLAEFATGQDEREGGDGYQASHWKRQGGDRTIGIMDPTLALGERGEISKLDLRLFDVLGWELTDPESAGQNSRRRNRDDDDDDDERGNARTIDKVKFLKTFRDQYKDAEASLAEKLDLSVQELWRNPTSVEQSLAQDRDFEVFEMLVNSQVYDLGWVNSVAQGSNSLWLAWRNWRVRGGAGFWEQVDGVFQTWGLYSTLEDAGSEASRVVERAAEASLPNLLGPETNQDSDRSATQASIPRVDRQDSLTGMAVGQAFASPQMNSEPGFFDVTNYQDSHLISHDFTDELEALYPDSVGPASERGTSLQPVLGASLPPGLGNRAVSAVLGTTAMRGLIGDQLLSDWQDVGSTLGSGL